MVATINIDDDEIPTPRHIPINPLGRLANDLNPLQASPGTLCTPKNVVIVMDGLREFNLMLLAWALENIVQPCCTLTILCILPYLNLPLQTKVWMDYWGMELQDLSALKERLDVRTDAKHLKLQAAIDLCKTYGVVPHMKVRMGFPLRLVVVEQITRLQATWVIFDRECGNLHNSRIRKYYTQRLTCTMVMINNKGEVDLIKGRSMINREEQNTPVQSPASLLPSPKVIFSHGLKLFLEEKQDKDQLGKKGASSLSRFVISTRRK